MKYKDDIKAILCVLYLLFPANGNFREKMRIFRSQFTNFFAKFHIFRELLWHKIFSWKKNPWKPINCAKNFSALRALRAQHYYIIITNFSSFTLINAWWRDFYRKIFEVFFSKCCIVFFFKISLFCQIFAFLTSWKFRIFTKRFSLFTGNPNYMLLINK